MISRWVWDARGLFPPQEDGVGFCAMICFHHLPCLILTLFHPSSTYVELPFWFALIVQANSSEQLEIRRQQEHERLLRVKERQEKRQIRRRREAVRDSYQFQYAEGIAEASNLVQEEEELMEMEWDGASNNNVGGGGERKLDDTLYEDDVVARNLFEQVSVVLLYDI